MADSMRYRIDYRSGDKDLTGSLAQAIVWANDSAHGAEVFDLRSMERRGDSALSEEDCVYTSRGRGEPTEAEREEIVYAREMQRDQEQRRARAAEPGDTRFERLELEDGILLVGYDDRGDEVSRDFFSTQEEVGSFIQAYREAQERDAHYRASGAEHGVWR